MPSACAIPSNHATVTKLSGDWQGFRDCHVEPDWVLIYRLDDEAVYLTRSGTHSDLY